MSTTRRLRRAAASRSPLEILWRSRWPEALAAWSPYTQLGEPIFCETDAKARPWGMAGQIAAIRLTDQLVMVNLETVRADKLDDLALPVLAHEIGHHVFVPGNLADNGRMLAAIRRELYGLPGDVAAMVANLYGDLHINDRLQGQGVDIAGVYRKLRESSPDEAKSGQTSAVWKVYTRAYEILWRLPKESLAPLGVTHEMELDATVVARLVKHFAGDWLRGARRFAALLYPWLIEDRDKQRVPDFIQRGLHDTKSAGAGADSPDAVPDGLAEIGEDEMDEGDDFDAEMADPLDEGTRSGRGRSRHQERKAENTAPDKEGKGRPGAQFREPFEYGELLKALGLNLSQHEVTTRYYRERALPNLIPFPERRQPRTLEPMPEGYETWEAQDPFEQMDLAGTIARSPVVIPGVTTVQRTFAEIPGSEPAPRPLDLDIYVDSSGSMPNPATTISYLALAGAILALSALRAGARVQATLWSGAGQFAKTDGFVRDEKQIIGIMTGFMGDGTAFPLNVLRKTYEDRKPDDPNVHIVVISDDGVDTMLQSDEKNNKGIDVARTALKNARGGGTLVLNIPKGGEKRLSALSDAGYRIHGVQQWEQLVDFARKFVRDNYAPK
ncbi:MAG: VWA domain-containing protein [Planctomycetes bacterium]|nr:VWA domain-containing protein [Planctomycetota bacterium]